jgi:membrane protease YdiL (CAAX protease family)
VVITWLFVRTRYSVAIPVLLHASGNASMGKVYDMLGNSVIEPLWPILYNALLVAIAIIVMLLADRRMTSVPTAPHEPTN